MGGGKKSISHCCDVTLARFNTLFISRQVLLFTRFLLKNRKYSTLGAWEAEKRVLALDSTLSWQASWFEFPKRPFSSEVTIVIAYFACFEKPKVGLCDCHAILYPPPPQQLFNASTNLYEI
jgi:hypothetical protein